MKRYVTLNGVYSKAAENWANNSVLRRLLECDECVDDVTVAVRLFHAKTFYF